MRLLHIPTTQPAIFAAINDPTHVSADFNALLFSIYFASVTSLDDSEVQLILGEDRESAVNLYQQGLEINLHASFFLDSPTVTSLQAMSIFLVFSPIFTNPLAMATFINVDVFLDVPP